MSKKEKEAEAREKRQYFDYLEAEELQEYQYMAIIKEQLLKEAHPDVALTKPAKRAQKKKASRTKAAPRSKTKKKRPRIDNGSSDWEDGDHFRVDDSDDVVVVNVVPSQPKSAFPICINDDEDAMSSKRTRKQRPQQAQTQTSVATTVSEQLQRPTQFRVGVVKKSYHHSHKISFELTEEEYSVLLNNVSLPKCPGVAGILKGQFPPAPSESLCPTCHSMMFLYHCQQSIINPPTT
ncbi:hypothetical protein DYB32_008125 [Aphanomyces invadans]|nr:hypothetical protein DYB32_008125 [Aphanomyces invadans]